MIIIKGLTKEGNKFRPSDWAERMSGVMSSFGADNRIHYSPMLKPVTREGVKCVAMDPALKDTHPEVFGFVMNFVEKNRLNVVNDGSDRSRE